MSSSASRDIAHGIFSPSSMISNRTRLLSERGDEEEVLESKLLNLLPPYRMQRRNSTVTSCKWLCRTSHTSRIAKSIEQTTRLRAAALIALVSGGSGRKLLVTACGSTGRLSMKPCQGHLPSASTVDIKA